MSNKDNEILIFIDTDTEDNQIENSLKSYSKVFKNFSLYKNTLPTRIGYQHNVNLMFRLAKNDVVLFIQSDMVAGPDFDKLMLAKLDKFNMVCGTRIEPPLHGQSPHTITQNLGLIPEEFQMGVFNDFCKQISNPSKVTSHFFAPFMTNRVVWLGIGGHDTRFRRSREDSDILVRLVLDGTKFVQPWDALFYHFTCTSSRGQGWYDSNNKEAQTKAAKQQFADRIEIYKFIHKWGTLQHDTEKKVVHYKIDCFVDVSSVSVDKIFPLVPLFDKIYLNDESSVINLRKKLGIDTVQIANELDGFSDEDWKSKKHLYNHENWDERIVYSPNKESIKSNALVIPSPVNISSLSPNFVEDVCNLHNTLKSGLCNANGRYDAEFFELVINNPIEDSNDKIIVKNPEYNDFKKIDTTN